MQKIYRSADIPSDDGLVDGGGVGGGEQTQSKQKQSKKQIRRGVVLLNNYVTDGVAQRPVGGCEWLHLGSERQSVDISILHFILNYIIWR